MLYSQTNIMRETWMDNMQKDTQAKMITSVVYIDHFGCVLVLSSILLKCVATSNCNLINCNGMQSQYLLYFIT